MHVAEAFELVDERRDGRFRTVDATCDLAHREGAAMKENMEDVTVTRRDPVVARREEFRGDELIGLSEKAGGEIHRAASCVIGHKAAAAFAGAKACRLRSEFHTKSGRILRPEEGVANGRVFRTITVDAPEFKLRSSGSA